MEKVRSIVSNTTTRGPTLCTRCTEFSGGQVGDVPYLQRLIILFYLLDLQLSVLAYRSDTLSAS
jgi:hypothetical protein